MSSTTLLAMFATALLVAQPAFAGDRTANAETASVRVPFRDLDLASEAGAKVMLHRISHAAKAICGPEPDDRVFDQARAYKACVIAITNRAVARLSSPLVTAANDGGSQPRRMELSINP